MSFYLLYICLSVYLSDCIYVFLSLSSLDNNIAHPQWLGQNCGKDKMGLGQNGVRTKWGSGQNGVRTKLFLMFWLRNTIISSYALLPWTNLKVDIATEIVNVEENIHRMNI